MTERHAFCGDRYICVFNAFRAHEGKTVRIENRAGDTMYVCHCGNPARWCLVTVTQA